MPKTSKTKLTFKKNKTGLLGRLAQKATTSKPLLAVVVMVVFAAIGGVYLLASKAATGRITVYAPAVAMRSAGTNSKYWIVTSDGGVYSEGGAAFYGSMGGKHLVAPITNMLSTSNHDGYWLLGGDGGVYAFGAAKYYGRPPAQAAGYYQSIMSTPGGGGYWVISRNGQIYEYGNAPSYSAKINAGIKKYNTGAGASLNGLPTSGIVDAARSASGYGLLLVSSNGSAYAYGDMPYKGNAPVNYAAGKRAVTVAVDGTNNGYVIAANDGSVYALGTTYRGGANTIGKLNGPIVAITMTPGAKGYWELGQDGGIFGYGDAKFAGNVSAPTTHVCWDNKTYLSTQACPPKPAPPAPTPPNPTGGGSSGSGGGSGLGDSSGGRGGGGTSTGGGSSAGSKDCDNSVVAYNQLFGSYNLEAMSNTASYQAALAAHASTSPWFTEINNQLDAYRNQLGWMRGDGVWAPPDNFAQGCTKQLNIAGIKEDVSSAQHSRDIIWQWLYEWNNSTNNARKHKSDR